MANQTGVINIGAGKQIPVIEVRDIVLLLLGYLDAVNNTMPGASDMYIKKFVTKMLPIFNTQDAALILETLHNYRQWPMIQARLQVIVNAPAYGQEGIKNE